ncbi:acyl-CoA reductase [Lentiprolixibacter aurantiacus]|uniref:long-chain-fatty-acyl-CoA reductase n=1 Tax=Lentiprolixibacter aurantiacus TaxID=2993939 RepID=A0AAE3MLB5_9FLAO|nr:acyl-CoA reductase [Lentiprolixibacter aurantiacus]MCX2719503.1 acyl-CoA reductase [Lentiprolixibacter aurantiacus]
MLEPQQRLEAFVKLGALFRDYIQFKSRAAEEDREENHLFVQLDRSVDLAGQKNGWFTEDQVQFALEVWGNCLAEERLSAWLEPYEITVNQNKLVALILAGNIPLVGFHDLLAVLLSGNNALVKLSSNDNVLLPALLNILEELAPGMKNHVRFEDEMLKDFDSVIATGSNNTARYFEYYFGKKPNIIRRNRNSAAVLKGTETKEELKALGRDVFQYYGLGCRSVSKLFIPQDFNFDLLFEAFESYRYLLEERKYQNNYDYNKAIYLMSKFPFLDNGFVMLKEDTSYASPIGTLFYERYEDLKQLKSQLQKDQEHIQCLVAKGFMENEVPFGRTQYPSLSDYADGVDTVEFLLKT